MRRGLDARLRDLEARLRRTDGAELLTKLWGELLRQRPSLQERVRQLTAPGVESSCKAE